MSWRQTIRQVAALPYRPEADGNIRVMLITSRETQRWVLPKGNLIKGLRAHEAAAQEAYEEAGVEGIACPTLIGSYTYAKRRKLEFHAISAVTGRGIDELKWALAKRVQPIAKTA